MRNLSQAYTELNTLSHRIENFLRISNYYNETRNFYGDDVEDLRKGYVEVQKEVALLVGKFAKL